MCPTDYGKLIDVTAAGPENTDKTSGGSFGGVKIGVINLHTGI
jgi:hypothetical protein